MRWRRAILDGMLGADHAGFLAQRWASAFLDCCEAVLGARVMRGAGGGGRVSHRGRVTDVAVHPLGVDSAALRARAAEADVRAAARECSIRIDLLLKTGRALADFRREDVDVAIRFGAGGGNDTKSRSLRWN